MEQKLFLLLVICLISSTIIIQINANAVSEDEKLRGQFFDDIDFLNETVTSLGQAVANLNIYFDQSINIEERLNTLEQIREDQMNILQEINEHVTTNHKKVENMEQDLPTIKEYIRVIQQVVNKKSPKLPMAVILDLTNGNDTKPE